MDDTSNAFTGALTITTNDSSGTDADVTIDGGTTALIIAASTIDGDLTVRSGNASGITDSGNVTVGGNLIATTDANSGVINMGTLRVDGTVALTTDGDGDATVVNDTLLDFANSTVRGNLVATATTGNIIDTGVLTISGTSTFTTSQSNDDITLGSVNVLTGAVTLNTSGSTGHAVVDNGTTALDIAASSVGGDLTLTSGHASGITDSGNVTVGGNLIATTDANSGVIDMGTLRVDGTVALTTDGDGDATVVNDTLLDFANSTVRGNLVATATTGHIIDTGTLTITGAAKFITTAGNKNIELNSASNAFASEVTMQAGTGSNVAFGNIAFVDSEAVKLHSSAGANGDLFIDGSTDGAVGGNLSITATTGNITQGIALDVTGTSSLVTSGQGATIDLTTTTNAFTGELLITTNDNNTPADGTYAAHASIDGGTTNLIIGTSTIDGNLTLLSGGTITDTASSTVTVKGDLNATTDANNSNITLDGLEVSGAYILDPHGTGIVTIVNAAGIDFVAMTVDGALSATATTGNITQSGALTITGTTTLVTSADNATITLNDAGNAFTGKLLITTNDTGSETDGDVEIDGGTTNLILGASTIDGDLTLRSGGTITDDGIATVRGTLTATTDQSDKIITLDELAVTGAFNLAPDGTGAVTIVNAAGLNLAASTMGGTFSGTATTGNISDSGTLAITGTTTLVTSADDATITLDDTSNAFTGALTITTNDSSGTDADVTIDGGTTALIIATSTIDGNLTVNQWSCIRYYG